MENTSNNNLDNPRNKWKQTDQFMIAPRSARGAKNQTSAPIGGQLSQRNNMDYDYLFKSDVSSGKSKILERFVYNRFGEKTQPTIGVEFIPKNIEMLDGSKVRLQLWDTAGSEKYRSITTGHYRNAVGAVLVYDISNAESFYNLNTWLEELRAVADEHIVIALLPNK